MKIFILLLYTVAFCFSTENSFSQGKVIISQDQLVSVDEVFEIIKQQTDYRFMYPNELFKDAPKVQLKKGEIDVMKLLNKSLSNINLTFKITNNDTILIREQSAINISKRLPQTQESLISGFVFDKKNIESLPFATIKLNNTDYYTIANEDGKFEFKIKQDMKVDSLEVRFMGYMTKRVALNSLIENPYIYLSPNVSNLNEVYLTNKEVNGKKKNYEYDLLYSLVEKYRKNNYEVKSKVFLSLASSARNVPIEHVEGFYNSTQNLSQGLINLDVKSGRFGQNKSFSYYSLDNTTILKDFELFNKSTEQIIPVYPGNMSLSTIKSKYKVNLDPCWSCDENDYKVSFTPKKVNPRLFSGSVIFNKKTLIIKKIELKIDNPKTYGLSTLSEMDIFTPQKINLNILFNPLDLSKIQHIDFTFDVLYTSTTFSELINSRTFLYFYDYDKQFSEPYFINEIKFKNDYDKIVALESSDEFWKIHYQFPKSYNDNRHLRFLQEYGFLINYDSSIPPDYIEYVRPSVLSWSEKNRIQWESIKHGLIKETEEVDNRTVLQGETIVADKVANSISETNMRSYKIVKEKMNFNYVVNLYKDKNGNDRIISRTIFNRNSSYSKNERSRNKLIYLNLIFDIYEIHRRTLESQIQKNQLSYSEIKKMYDDKFKEASQTVNKMKKETSFSANFQNLTKWNKIIKSKLHVNNFELITDNN